MLVSINKPSAFKKMNHVKHKFLILTGFIMLFALCSFVKKPSNKHALTINVYNLKNNVGAIQFTLYNKEGSIPDEHFRNYHLQLTSKIINNSSSVTFENLNEGDYSINILHDENEDGKIEKGFILPIEGIGFSNLSSINPLNRPSFNKTKFELKKDTSIEVSIIYM